MSFPYSYTPRRRKSLLRKIDTDIQGMKVNLSNIKTDISGMKDCIDNMCDDSNNPIAPAETNNTNVNFRIVL